MVPQKHAVGDDAGRQERARLEQTDGTQLRRLGRGEDDGCEQQRDPERLAGVLQRVALFPLVHRPGGRDEHEQREHDGGTTPVARQVHAAVPHLRVQNGYRHSKCEQVRLSPEAALDDRVPVRP
jgi:hypothetical protein